ncbi:MAG: hypothetical protein ACI828_002791, partial [Flavobacteriales bacterium]
RKRSPKIIPIDREPAPDIRKLALLCFLQIIFDVKIKS